MHSLPRGASHSSAKGRGTKLLTPMPSLPLLQAPILLLENSVGRGSSAIESKEAMVEHCIGDGLDERHAPDSVTTVEQFEFNLGCALPSVRPSSCVDGIAETSAHVVSSFWPTPIDSQETQPTMSSPTVSVVPSTSPEGGTPLPTLSPARDEQVRTKSPRLGPYRTFSGAACSAVSGPVIELEVAAACRFARGPGDRGELPSARGDCDKLRGRRAASSGQHMRMGED